MSRLAMIVATALFPLLTLTSGCTWVGFLANDPNCNPKIRYLKTQCHAKKVLQDAGSDLQPRSPDYATACFLRLHYDKSTRTHHKWELKDFIKTTFKPGPNHFVIVYDWGTRETYLRVGLRSTENLEHLPPAGEPIDGDDIQSFVEKQAFKAAQYAEAERVFKLALKEVELSGLSSACLATNLNNLALLYFNQGKYDKAEPLYNRSLAIYEKSLGPNHRDVATTLAHLAKLLEATGRQAEADQLLKRAAAIRSGKKE